MELRQYYQKHEKYILFFLLTIYFVVPYFLISYLTSGREVFLSSSLDEKIPFIPEFILIYLSAFLFVGMPYFLIDDKKYFRKVILTYFAVMGLCYIFYFIFPVQRLNPNFMGGGFFEMLVNLLYSIDITHNCFPSLHVAMSFLSGMVCFRYDRKYGWFLIWVVLIIVSTLFIKQHYLLDIAGGLVVGIAGYAGFVELLKGGEWISKKKNYC